MARTRINSDQIRLDPSSPLIRRGCEIVSSLNIDDVEYWRDTLLSPPDSSLQTLNKIRSLLPLYGENIFCILRKLCGPSGSPKQEFVDISLNINLQNTFNALLSLGLIEKSNEKYRLINLKGSIGNTYECYVHEALEDLGLQTLREVKIKYPFKAQKKFDPDGQKYDLLSGIDLTRLLWIECKKPNYSNQAANPLGNIISKDLIKKFYNRSWLLQPDIAIFLVDTKENYIDLLKNIFGEAFIQDTLKKYSGSDYDQIVLAIKEC